MKPLTIEVADNHSELLVGWKCLDAIACSNHGVAVIVLIRPEVAKKFNDGTLDQPARWTLLDCVVKKMLSVVQHVFGVSMVAATVAAITPPGPMPPKPPDVKPQEN